MTSTGYISWEDVNIHLKDLKDRHNVWARVEFTTPEHGMSPNSHLVVKVITQYQEPGKNSGWECVSLATWPTYGHRNMTGLILRLIHEMGERLLRERPKPRKMWTGTHFPRA